MTFPEPWCAVDAPPSFKTENEVQVWRVSLERSGVDAEAMQVLSPEERTRADRMGVMRAREQFVAARAALRGVLAGYLGVPPATLRFGAGEHGKLYLMDHALSFNLSHAGAWALIAVTRRHPVGVDIEKISSSRASAAIAERFFSPTEQAMLAAYKEDAARAEAFFRIWSRKEAVIKALGEGLACPLATFDVTAGIDEARLLSFRRTGLDPAAWTLKALPAASGYAAALAVIGPCDQFLQYDYAVPDVNIFLRSTTATSI